ncbi:type I glyceraldehyde-3-phosphate dehydrogenase [candidate division WWE3 bacterium]|nr:type I glyceraldehyde-3-phosphate dehydrogenase [candidate division WWE3 bacterium]
MSARIAINGFGRIGRAAFRIILEKNLADVVVINDLTNARILAHLLKYDTAYGIYPAQISVEEDGVVVETEGNSKMEEHFVEVTPKESYLVVNGKKTKVISEKDPANLPWKDMGIDVVLECTGRFTKDGSAKAHITAGAKKVVVSAPTSGDNDDVMTFLKGVNHESYLGQNVISNASCTTNCIAPVASVIHANFKILKSLMTTVHSITAEQSIVDGPPPGLHPDLRRARAAGHNIIPTTTGAAKAIGKVIPELNGKFDGIALRVPTLVGSLSDITFVVEKQTTVEEVNKAFIKAKENPFYKGVLDTTWEPLVSSDIVGSPFSTIVDLSMTKVVGGDLVKVLAWYDNEWGYANRLVEMALLAVS